MHKRLLSIVLLLVLALVPGSYELGGTDAKIWTQFPSSTTTPSPPMSRNVGNAAPIRSNNSNQRNIDATLWTPVGTQEAGSLNATAALTPDDIWAVGQTRGMPAKALVVHWDGKTWRIVATFSGGPIPSDPTYSNPPNSFPQQGSRLYDVAALSPENVWVVGAYDIWADAGTSSGDCCWVPQPLIANWDGKDWKIVRDLSITRSEKQGAQHPRAALYASRGSASLNAIAAVAPDDIWIVGEHGGGGGPLALHWDGSGWRNVPVPDHQQRLTSVSALSSDDIWAAGGDRVIHWDGKAWREVYKGRFYPSTGFRSIVALSTGDVWAVGNSNIIAGSGDIRSAYAVHWDGKDWTYVPMFSHHSSYGGAAHTSVRTTGNARVYTFSSVFALAPDDVWIAGGQDGTPLLMHWDGKYWNVNPCPARGLDIGLGPLADLIVFSDGVMWTVGSPHDGFGAAPERRGFILSPGSGPCSRVQSPPSSSGGPAEVRPLISPAPGQVYPSTLIPPAPMVPVSRPTPVP